MLGGATPFIFIFSIWSIVHMKILIIAAKKWILFPLKVFLNQENFPESQKCSTKEPSAPRWIFMCWNTVGYFNKNLCQMKHLTFIPAITGIISQTPFDAVKWALVFHTTSPAFTKTNILTAYFWFPSASDGHCFGFPDELRVWFQSEERGIILLVISTHQNNVPGKI